MEVSPEILFPFLAATVTAALSSMATVYAVKRARSGRINSSEADELWEESTALRRELREEIRSLKERISDNESEIDELRNENAELKHEVLQLRTENASLTIQVSNLKQENRTLRNRADAQEGRMEEEHEDPAVRD